MILSRKEVLILEILQESGKEMYGLEMIKVSGGQLKRGTIYVILSTMQDKGLISSRKESEEESVNGVQRYKYRLTEDGRRSLSEDELSNESFATS